MPEPTAQEAAYLRATEIANALLGEGIPVVGFRDLDGGAAIGIAFQMREDKNLGLRLPLAEATPEAFRKLYEASK